MSDQVGVKTEKRTVAIECPNCGYEDEVNDFTNPEVEFELVEIPCDNCGELHTYEEWKEESGDPR